MPAIPFIDPMPFIPFMAGDYSYSLHPSELSNVVLAKLPEPVVR